ncbi:MAG: dihydroorotate dehydrogenase-like protein [Bacteroidales bacterium]|nr:dihydroorotate dehydrogenase-like protein [Bacteroidales bacterium]
MNTNVEYLGLKLKSPILAGSCGLTANVDNLCKLEKAGAGAVVLKSIFEEQIIYDIKRNTHVYAPVGNYGDSYEYIAQHVADDSVSKHFALIREAKKQLTIPVIGSINCFSYENWLTYAKQFQDAGCDALELNMAIMPFETSLSTDDVERTFSNIVQSLKKSISIPISIKVGTYFTDLAKFMQQLSWMGIQGITMFNKSMQIDVDVEEEKLCNADSLTYPGELYNTLRWTAILSRRLRCNLCATTGVDNGLDVAKLLLAGASAVQVASCLYRNGLDYMRTLNDELKGWMERKGYESVDQFRGKLAMRSNDKASMLMRTQFMNYFADIK